MIIIILMTKDSSSTSTSSPCNKTSGISKLINSHINNCSGSCRFCGYCNL